LDYTEKLKIESMLLEKNAKKIFGGRANEK
jgi:hypothetical protein